MSDIKKDTFQEQAYKYIKSKIVNLGFKPGEYLTDIQIAENLDISRTPVREAYRMLEREGLLVYEPRRGWRVYSLSLEDIHEIFEIKIALEGLIVRKSAKCDDPVLKKKLKETISLMRKASDEDDVNSWVELDMDLHHLIFMMAKNQRVMNFIENINDQWNRLRVGFSARTGRITHSILEHEAIVDAILSGDPDLAEKEMVSHLILVRDELVTLLINMVLPYAKDGI
jgi:DNA-binding GntR family transcriptional regulator